jgi:hypothetical protein
MPLIPIAQIGMAPMLLLDKPEVDSMSIGCTRDVMRMMDEGKQLKEIRSYIEKTYSRYGPSTPTPAVPLDSTKINEFWVKGK